MYIKKFTVTLALTNGNSYFDQFNRLEQATAHQNKLANIARAGSKMTIHDPEGRLISSTILK